MQGDRRCDYEKSGERDVKGVRFKEEKCRWCGKRRLVQMHHPNAPLPLLPPKQCPMNQP